MAMISNNTIVDRYVVSREIKLEGERRSSNPLVTITLPCGQKRRMHLREFRALTERCKELVQWLSDDAERREF